MPIATLSPSRPASPSTAAASFWSTRREASLNWLALGLLLAAWNASDNDAATLDAASNDAASNDAASNDAARHAAAQARRRPDALRGYDYVSVRAVNRVSADER